MRTGKLPWVVSVSLFVHYKGYLKISESSEMQGLISNGFKYLLKENKMSLCYFGSMPE